LNRGAADRPESISLGQIVGAQGLRGELKVRPQVDDLDTLLAVGEVRLAGASHRVTGARWHKQTIIMTLAGVTTREQAEALRGEELRVDPRQLPALPEGEYYWFEILGLPVLRGDDRSVLGRLTQIIATGAHDVYVVEGEGGEHLIPAVDEVIREINLTDGWIVVDPDILWEEPGAV